MNIHREETFDDLRNKVQGKKSYQIYLLVNGMEVKGTERVEDLLQSSGYLEISVEEALPVPPENCMIKPSFCELQELTYAELRSVENFQIENEHGRVVFLEPVDLVGVNLAQAIQIKPRRIDVYEGEGIQKPEMGTKLLKQAELTIFDYTPKKVGQSIETDL